MNTADRIKLVIARYSTSFVEAEHPRNHGKFSEKAGDSVNHAEPSVVDKTGGNMTHHELAQQIADIVGKAEGFAGKIVSHKDGTVRVYLKEHKGKKGWVERGEAEIDETGKLVMDKAFEHAFFYDKPVLESLRALPSAVPRSESTRPILTGKPFVAPREEAPDDPMERMQFRQERGSGGGKYGDES